MSREYRGDINGYFWSCIQSSTAPERFGCSEVESVINYEISKDEINFCKEEIDLITEKLGGKKDKIDKFFKDHSGWNHKDLETIGISEEDLEEYADLELGMKIYNHLLENDYCNFEADI